MKCMILAGKATYNPKPEYPYCGAPAQWVMKDPKCEVTINGQDIPHCTEHAIRNSTRIPSYFKVYFTSVVST